MNINRALVAACILCAVGLLSQILSILVVTIGYDKSLTNVTMSSSADQPQMVAIMTANYHEALCWHVAEAALYLAIAALLFFVIRELETRSQVNPL